MGKKSLNVIWAAKLLKAKHFVVVTDKEGIINISGKNLKRLSDRISVATQAAVLESFYERLGEVIKEHDAKVEAEIAQEEKQSKAKRSARA